MDVSKGVIDTEKGHDPSGAKIITIERFYSVKQKDVGDNGKLQFLCATCGRYKSESKMYFPMKYISSQRHCRDCLSRLSEVYPEDNKENNMDDITSTSNVSNGLQKRKK